MKEFVTCLGTLRGINGIRYQALAGEPAFVLESFNLAVDPDLVPASLYSKIEHSTIELSEFELLRDNDVVEKDKKTKIHIALDDYKGNCNDVLKYIIDSVPLYKKITQNLNQSSLADIARCNDENQKKNLS